jgi:hypothetical protein
MTVELAKEQYIREAVETEISPNTLGVVLIIIDKNSIISGDPRIWTVNELVEKPETDRIPGQIAIPAETRKVDEDKESTVLGGLAEFTDSDDVVNRLKIIPGKFYVKSAFELNGFEVDMAFLVYDGPTDEEIKPTDVAEVEPNGWISFSDAAFLNGEMRSFAHDSIEFIQNHKIIEHIAGESDSLVPLTSIYDGDFCLRDFLEARDNQNDIPLD